jgi:hypothetical protein
MEEAAGSGLAVANVPAGYPATLLRETTRGGVADTGRGAGDDHNFVVQSSFDHDSL